jgi:hypothetical protein
MKLKPCPFCGGTRIKTRRLSEMLGCTPSPLDFYKNCEGCDACGPLGVRPTSAGALWNDRTADSNPTNAQATAQARGGPIAARSYS